MGTLIYDDSVGEQYELDDRTLLHLKLAVGAKFRRLESFVFTLSGSELRAGRGHRVFWMHPAVPLEFRFDSLETDLPVNVDWVDALITAASTESGLRIVPEPERLSLKS